MPTESTPGATGLRPSKPTTRNSIRQSLNLSSMGKALADVMNKSEGRGAAAAEKVKKTKDIGSTTSSRRTSAAGLTHSSTMSASGRTFIGEAKSSVARRENTADTRTVTRTTRRTSLALKSSTASVDEHGVNCGETTTHPQLARVTRSSSLRPRSSQATALPKYRPKSTVVDAKKSATPLRIGTRRRLSSSDDDDDDDVKELRSDASLALRSPEEKSTRPISPLPQRASALKVSLTAAIRITPSTPEKKGKITSPKATCSPIKTTAPPVKSAKTSPTASVRQPGIPRPPSSSSSRTSPTTPRTPKGPSSLRNALGFGRSGDSKGKNKGLSSLSGSAPVSPVQESPLAKHSRKDSVVRTPTAHTNTTPLHTDSNEDSFDVDDVEMLLAPTASLAAPTPAIPRLQPSRFRRRDGPATPTRSGLPSRNHLSYISPLPPTAEESPSLRPGYEKGSLMSWDQLAKESSRTLTEEEAESMITGVDLPFKSSTGSPPLSPEILPMHLDVPESPCLSAMPSPGGYASIAHVLLPDVTPSPAVHSEDRYDDAPEIPAVDAAIVTLFRLQLASAENTAKERLQHLQALEEELHRSKEARLRETDELERQVSFLEQQLHSNVETREKANDERAAYCASLEDQLRHAEAFRDQAIETAVAEAEKRIRASWAGELRAEQRKWKLTSTAHGAAMEWKSVHSAAENELDAIKADREMLTVLLAGLDQSQRQIC